jgi:hypothetical protein
MNEILSIGDTLHLYSEGNSLDPYRYAVCSVVSLAFPHLKDYIKTLVWL